MKHPIFVLACLAVFGCASEEQTTQQQEDTNATEKLVVSDDPSAIAAINAVGAKTKKNDAGLIIEVNLRESQADDDTLKAIASLEHVQSLLLNEIEISDDGLKALHSVTWPIANLDLRGCPVSNTGLEHLNIVLLQQFITALLL